MVVNSGVGRTQTNIAPPPLLSDRLATVVLPASDYAGVARLVVAGVAARLDLGYTQVDDLQLAIDTILRCVFEFNDSATATIETGDSSLVVAVGPADSSLLKRRFHQHEGRDSIELRTMLERLVDEVTIRLGPEQVEQAIALRVAVP
jgi:hypothetical protein